MKRLFDSASAFPALASMAGITLISVLFLHAESQEEVLGLTAGAVVMLLLLARFGWNALAAASFAGHSRMGQGAVLAGVLIVVVAFYDQHFPLLMLTTVLLYIVVCLGLNLQFGYAGVVNFAGAAFFGIGCYTAAVLTSHTGLPHLAVVLIGGLMAAGIGSLLLLPVLRTSGHYAALVTIAFSILFRVFIEVNDTLGGPQGMKVDGDGDFRLEAERQPAVRRDRDFLLRQLRVDRAGHGGGRLHAGAAPGALVDRSCPGCGALDETASAAFGIDVARWKITAFTLGNFLIGLAGAVYAMMTGFVAPNAFTFGDSLILVSIVILGGIGNPWGLTVAAAIVLMMPEKLQFIQEYRLLLFAGLVILILLFRPGGLMPRQVRNYIPGWKP